LKRFYLLLFLILYSYSSLYGVTQNDLQKIQERNTNILLHNKERMEFEKNTQIKRQDSKEIETHQIEDENLLNTKNCFDIEKIIYHDNKVLDDDDFNSITRLYENRCLTQQNIHNLLKRVTNKYMSQGYITSQAYLKEQDLSSKILHVNLLEGKVSEIYINNLQSMEAVTSFPNIKDSILNLRDIEMGLEQINRLYRNKATLNLKAAKEVGYSDVYINNQENKPIFTIASINNNGSESTGKSVGSLQLYIENIFGLNSQFSIGLNGALKQSDEKKSRGYSLELSIPYGYFLFSSGYRQYLYRSTIYGDNDNYISSGESSSYFHNLAYTTYRDAKTTVKMNFGLDIKQNLNFIANELIKISSIKLTVAKIELDISHKINNTKLSSIFTLHQGLSLFDPIKESDNKYKKAEFRKYTAYISANSYFDLFNVPLNLSSSLSGQYSNDKLYSPELFSMGGFYSVRGFSNMGYYGEIGSYIHNDLTYYTSLSVFGKNFMSSFYIGLDGGVVEYDKGVFKHMIGSGFGSKMSLNNFSVSLDFGIPLYAHDPIAEEEFSSSFSLGYQY